jgi:predicted transposase/invertase (TIGR01784 family)
MDTASKQKYDHYLKEVRISQDMLETAKSKGKIEGKIEGKIDMILVLFDDKISITQIAKYASLSEDEIGHILKQHGKM